MNQVESQTQYKWKEFEEWWYDTHMAKHADADVWKNIASIAWSCARDRAE